MAARYEYDAWGACTTYTGDEYFEIAELNPYRYRGYYYDTDTELYYLQSRYYDPKTGRFLNADEPEYGCVNKSVMESNLFSYCENDPVNKTDYDGNILFTIIAKCILGAMFGLLAQLTSDLIEYAVKKYVLKQKVAEQFSPTSPFGDYLGSAVAWALNTLSPCSKVAKVLLPLIPVGAKHVTNILRGQFKLRDFMVDLGAAVLTAAISLALTHNASRQLKTLRKFKKNSKNLKLKATKKAIKYKLNLRITKVSITMTSLDAVIILILNIILKVK